MNLWATQFGDGDLAVPWANNSPDQLPPPAVTQPGEKSQAKKHRHFTKWRWGKKKQTPMITLEALLFPFGKSSYKFNESHRVRKTEGFMEELDGDKI